MASPPYRGVRGGLLDDYPSSILDIHALLLRLGIKFHAFEGKPGVVIIIGDDTQTCGYTIVLLEEGKDVIYRCKYTLFIYNNLSQNR